MKIVVATNNPHKVMEFERILAPLGIDVISQAQVLSSANICVEEDADSFEGNAYLKAKAVFDAAQLPTVADDSGICVDALNGAPGVYSARYGGEGLDDVDRYNKLLFEMKDVEDSERTARFVCSISLILSSDKVYNFTGVCEGKIGYYPLGENGFGYDPVFMVGDESFSTLSAPQKDKISHRGKALRAMADMLVKL